MPSFSEVITHQSHLKTLHTAVIHGNMPHAMLFWGPEGSGALASALALAAYLVCTDRKDTGPCGNCKGCVKSDKHLHPDIHYAFPTIGAKVTGNQLYPQWREAITENIHLNRQQWLERLDAEGKQGNINVDDIHRILHVLSLKPVEADCKILVIWLPEYLGKDGNRLLKMIEEPMPDTYIFLVAENREEILPTILSRCQQYYFPLFSTSEIKERLTTILGIDEQRAGWVASAASGDWNAALQLAQGQAYNPVQWAQGWVKAAWSKDPMAITSWTDDAAKHSREENKQLIRYFLGLLEKVLWLKYGKDFFASEEEHTLIGFLNKKIEIRELITLVALCEENLRAIQQNANGKIMWYHLTIIFQKMLHAENAALQDFGIQKQYLIRVT